MIIIYILYKADSGIYIAVFFKSRHFGGIKLCPNIQTL